MRNLIQVHENLKLKICKFFIQSRIIRGSWWMWFVIIANALNSGCGFKSYSLVCIRVYHGQWMTINLQTKTRMIILLYCVILFLPLVFVFWKQTETNYIANFWQYINKILWNLSSYSCTYLFFPNRSHNYIN